MACKYLPGFAHAVQPLVDKMQIRMRDDIISARKRVAVTLHQLAHGDYYDSLSLVFGIGKTTTFSSVHLVAALDHQLFGASIACPIRIRVSSQRYRLSAMPQCAGVIDGCVIPIEVPGSPFADTYWCYKYMHCKLLLAPYITDGQEEYAGHGFAAPILISKEATGAHLYMPARQSQPDTNC